MFEVGLGDNALAERVGVLPGRRTEQTARPARAQVSPHRNLFRSGLLAVAALWFRKYS
jgi:hypothetical protein